MIASDSARIPYQSIASSSKKRDAVLRLFSRKHAERYRFAQLSLHEQEIIKLTVTAANGKIAFVKNPKAGCTTVANLLYRYDNGHDYDGKIHQAPVGVGGGVENWSSVMQALRNGVSFSIVRNPQARAISGFFGFFVDRRNKVTDRHLERIEAFGFSAKDDIGYRFDVFLDYLKASFALSELNTDHHFRAQHINVGQGAFELSHIGRVEALDDALRKVSDMAGVALPGTQSVPTARQNRGGGSSKSFAPSAEQKRKIETLYARDYELFGY